MTESSVERVSRRLCCCERLVPHDRHSTLIAFTAGKRIHHHISRILFRSTATLLAVLGACLTSTAQQTAPAKSTSSPTMASMMEAQLGIIERQFVAAAEAMPENKYSFAPTGANFVGVRTFALEVRHTATANFVIYSSILGQDPPPGVTVDGTANGPESLLTKEQIVQYLKDSFSLGHRAMAALNDRNALAPLDKLPIAIASLNTRLAVAIFSFTHASDHYGQIVEYLRMNGIVPPPSVGQPPANPSASSTRPGSEPNGLWAFANLPASQYSPDFHPQLVSVTKLR